MELSFMADTISLPRHHLSTVSAAFSATSAVAPPPVKPKPISARRALLKSRRRTKRRSSPSSDGGDGDFDFGDGGFFGGGSGGNFDGFGGGFHNWGGDDWSSGNNPEDPAFDFVYEVLCWLVLSNCVHFAVKKVVVRVGSEGRDKIPVRIPSVC